MVMMVSHSNEHGHYERSYYSKLSFGRPYVPGGGAATKAFNKSPHQCAECSRLALRYPCRPVPEELPRPPQTRFELPGLAAFPKDAVFICGGVIIMNDHTFVSENAWTYVLAGIAQGESITPGSFFFGDSCVVYLCVALRLSVLE